MKPDDIVMACICDYAGQVKGKGFRGVDLEGRLRSGVGLAPTNLMITAFGQIVDSPWGPRGELLMMPIAETETTAEVAHGTEEVVVITPQAPLGQQLVGRRTGDRFKDPYVL